MREWGRADLLLCTSLLLGCSGPALGPSGAPAKQWSLELEPALDDRSVAALFRGRLKGVGAAGEPWLFRGDLSEYQSRALRRGEVASSLAARAVPLRFGLEGEDCWLQPLDWLEANETYTLAFTGVGVLRGLRADGSALPRSRRLFPPQGSAKHRVEVVCDLPLDAQAQQLELLPGPQALRATPGIGEVPAPGCMTLKLEGDSARAGVAPVALGGALLDPYEWQPQPSDAGSGRSCPAGQPLHGACLEVLDDRVSITPQDADLLWLLTRPHENRVALRAGTRGVLVRDLSPLSVIELGGFALSTGGELEPWQVSLSTLAPRRHLVLNEVLANPAGPEPSAEWVELVNDAARPASLADLWLEDAGGHVALPAGELAPGELVLLVPDGFRDSNLDVPIPPTTRRFALRSLGARGLSNGGEPLLLVGPEGVLSRFPALAAVHAGRSMARRTVDGPDDEPQEFAEHGAPGASPGAANSFAESQP